jgi:uncharacterized membrane protein (Fun14 family)
MTWKKRFLSKSPFERRRDPRVEKYVEENWRNQEPTGVEKAVQGVKGLGRHMWDNAGLGGKIAIGGVGGLMAAQAVRRAIKAPVAAAIGVAPAIGGYLAAKAIIKGVKKRRARKEAEKLIAQQEQQAVKEQTYSEMFGKEREKRIAEEYRRSRGK